MHNVVIIHIVYSHPIIVIGRFHHLVGGRVHLHVAVVTIITHCHHCVALNQLPLVQHHRLFGTEISLIAGILAFHQTHMVARLVLKDKQMRSLLQDAVLGIAHTMQHQRVTYYLEIYRQTRGVRIVDGIALSLKRHVFLAIVQPDTLQHLLGRCVLTRRYGSLSLFATAHHEQPNSRQQHDCLLHRPIQ